MLNVHPVSPQEVSKVEIHAGTHGIDRFKFDNFHDGSSATFAPDHDQHVFFDDLAVQEGECPPGNEDWKNPRWRGGTLLPAIPAAGFPITTTITPKITPTINSTITPTMNVTAPLPIFIGMTETCVGLFKRCHGPALSDRACCTTGHCLLRNETFGQCRPMDRGIPTNWLGAIVEYPSAASANPLPMSATVNSTIISPEVIVDVAKNATIPSLLPEATPANVTGDLTTTCTAGSPCPVDPAVGTIDMPATTAPVTVGNEVSAPANSDLTGGTTATTTTRGGVVAPPPSPTSGAKSPHACVSAVVATSLMAAVLFAL